MKNHRCNVRFNLKPLAVGVALACALSTAEAKGLLEAERLLEAAGDPNESKFMKTGG